MQRFYFLLVFIAISGCKSDKKEITIRNQVEKATVIDNSASDMKLQDTAVNKEETNNNTIPDSVVDSNTIKEEVTAKEVIPETLPKKETPKEEIIEKEIEKIRPDHSVWNQLTKKYVSSKGKVNYNGFKSNISTIEKYLSHLQVTSPKKDWTKKEKLAYWFNLYNAATVQLIANAYPIKSIKDINGGKPWDKKFVKSGNQIYSLNQIENTIVRPNFNEPRLHVAFNCAAVSCPKLLNEAFSPSKLYSQLNKLSSTWINDPTKNKITENSIEISKIFEWYGSDFKKGIIPFINRYATIKANGSAKIQYLEYNWNLND
ncbi:DUF547 domain-containing protein [uncultured Aquimarina sp.]|uniref:DUF547 domain-containing protein n=1 Tax=uncultured Aquimarina sp. TaxID=575652 RepID=UPI00261CE88F|nr:DUF547 domain-containing protein [uncultured Aquimarina sp.]